jgi:hypothetical protein
MHLRCGLAYACVTGVRPGCLCIGTVALAIRYPLANLEASTATMAQLNIYTTHTSVHPLSGSIQTLLAGPQSRMVYQHE